MRLNNQWMILLILITCLHLVSCDRENHTANDEGDQQLPGRVEVDAKTGLQRVILTAEAAKRINLQLSPVKAALVNGVAHKTVPYSAILYDLHGETWIYTNVTPLVFVRALVKIDTIQNNIAILLDGPPEGTLVVSVGASQLYGTEFLGTIEP